jgi:hypothetical membrane protein
MYVTTTKIEPSRSLKKLLMIAGVCGILAVIVDWSSVALAIYYSPGLDLAQNWLGDLTGLSYAGFLNVSRPLVSSPTTEVLFRSGFIIGGILHIVFLIGFYYDGATPSHRLGAVLGVLGSGALTAMGIFPEPMGVISYMLVAMFASLLLYPTAIFLIGGALIDTSHKRLGGLSIALGIVALAATSVISYLRGSAQVIAFLAISIWGIVFSVRMVWRASHQVELT